jgi:hypothetical protein
VGRDGRIAGPRGEPLELDRVLFTAARGTSRGSRRLRKATSHMRSGMRWYAGRDCHRPLRRQRRRRGLTPFSAGLHAVDGGSCGDRSSHWGVRRTGGDSSARARLMSMCDVVIGCATVPRPRGIPASPRHGRHSERRAPAWSCRRRQIWWLHHRPVRRRHDTCSHVILGDQHLTARVEKHPDVGTTQEDSPWPDGSLPLRPFSLSMTTTG